MRTLHEKFMKILFRTSPILHGLFVQKELLSAGTSRTVETPKQCIGVINAVTPIAWTAEVTARHATIIFVTTPPNSENSSCRTASDQKNRPLTLMILFSTLLAKKRISVLTARNNPITGDLHLMKSLPKCEEVKGLEIHISSPSSRTASRIIPLPNSFTSLPMTEESRPLRNITPTPKIRHHHF